jgi:hypothetical protein
LYESLVGVFSHFTAKSVYLSYKVTFSGSTHIGIARHICNAVQVDGKNNRFQAQPGGRKCGFAACVAGSDHNDVIFTGMVSYHLHTSILEVRS